MEGVIFIGALCGYVMMLHKQRYVSLISLLFVGVLILTATENVCTGDMQQSTSMPSRPQNIVNEENMYEMLQFDLNRSY